MKQDIDAMKAEGIPEHIIAGIFAEKGPTVEELIKEIMGEMGGANE